MSRLTVFAVILGVGAVGACGGASDTTTPPPFTQNVAIVSGDQQSAMMGKTLSIPLTIAVSTSDAQPTANVLVIWAVTVGGGQLSNVAVRTDNQGQASATWTLGYGPGNQSVSATATQFGISSVLKFSAVATPPPVILHFDGARWSTALEDVTGARVSFASIWGATGSDVFAVGRCYGGAVILQYDGSGWGEPPPTCPTFAFPADQYTSVGGSSASNVFVTYSSNQPLASAGNVRHYDGQAWSGVYAPDCNGGFLCPNPRAVWSSSPSDAFTVGDRGIVAHFDGTGWNALTSGTTQSLSAVWGEGQSGAVFAVGAGGTILYYDRTAWHAQPSGTTQSLYAVWGTSANDVFAVGAAGTILHYDGTNWTPQVSGSTQALHAVWGISGSPVFAVGDASTILRYDGTSWTSLTTFADMNLRGIWGTSPTNVFAVGAPR